jgi:hypothetical protein
VNDATLIALALLCHRDVAAWALMQSGDPELEREDQKRARAAFALSMNAREQTLLKELGQRITGGIVVAKAP